MRRVGLTGGIGTGKSIVAQVFNLLGVPVYEADKKAKILLSTDNKIITEVKKLLGEQTYVNGSYNSKWISKEVFKNHDLLKKLNAIVHPRVASDWEQWCKANNWSPYVIKEAAIMNTESTDYIINVTAPLSIRVDRVLLRDSHRTASDIESIISNQSSDQYFKDISNFEIRNGTSDLILPQVLEIHEKLMLTLKH